MTLNKAFASISILFTVLFLAAWTPLETSNNSVVRLSAYDRDFCSGVVVSRIDEDWVYVATAAHCAEATAIPMEEKVYLPNGKFKIKYYTAYPEIRVKQDKMSSEGIVGISINAAGHFVREDMANDVAIYKVLAPVGYVIPATLAVYEVKYGDKVYAMGMPFGIFGTISPGEVTKPRLGKIDNMPTYIPADAIVHTAYMKPGISGGGLFDAEGNLIGLTNWGQSGGPYIATRVSHVIDLLKVINENK